MALSVSIRPSKFAISWLSSSVEWDGWRGWTSSTEWGGGFEALIRDGGVPMLMGSFLYGDEVGLIVTCGCETVIILNFTPTFL